MEVNNREKLFAGLFPLVLVGSAYLSLWVPVLFGVASLILVKRFESGYCRTMTMKNLDVLFSYFVYSLLAGVLGGAVRIAARDSGHTIPFLSDGRFSDALMLLVTVASLIAFLGLAIGGFMGWKPSIPLALRPFSFFDEESRRQPVAH